MSSLTIGFLAFYFLLAYQLVFETIRTLAVWTQTPVGAITDAVVTRLDLRVSGDNYLHGNHCYR